MSRFGYAAAMRIGLWARSAAARRLWVCPVLAALLLMACTHTTSCGKGDKHVFETPAKEPRAYLIVLRSYRGSQESLMSAAMQLISQNPRFGEANGGAEAVFLGPKGAEPAHAVSAITMLGAASIAELLRMLEAVGERLTPVPDRDPAHPAIKLELWWVQDVHVKGPGLELPNPLILDEWWANDLFASAASDHAVSAAEEGKESKLWVGRVARMFEGNRGKGVDPRVVMQNDLERLTASREGQRATFQTMSRDSLGLLAQAARTAFVVDIVAHQSQVDSKFAAFVPERQVRKAETMADERALSWVEPVSLDIPEGADLPAQIRLWIAACRATARAAQLAVGSVVVFDATARKVHGALLGEKLAVSDLVPYAQLESDINISPFEPSNPKLGKVLKLSTTVAAPAPASDGPTPPSPSP